MESLDPSNGPTGLESHDLPHMQTLKLWLIRHGQTVVGADGLYRPHNGLTDLGHTQAAEVATAISDYPIEVCYTSRLPRAIETAMHYTTDRDVDLVQLGDLNEVNTGDIFSAADSLKQRVIGHDFDLDFSQFGGESVDEFVARVTKGLDAMLRDIHERQVSNAAAFLHGGTIGAILDIVSGEKFSYRRRPRMPNCAYTVVAFDTDHGATRWERWECDHLTVLT